MPRSRLWIGGIGLAVFTGLAALNVSTNPGGSVFALIIGVAVVTLLGLGFLLWLVAKPRI